MQISQLPTDQLIQNALLYACLPLWVIMGLADYLCHRKAAIERTTGIKESLMHVAMGAQIGVAVFLGLTFEINVLLLLMVGVVLVLHVWVAHHDVTYALRRREITVWETHAHSFLEVLPFVVVLLLAFKRWPAFVDLVTLNWAGNLTLVQKTTPLDAQYIVGYFAFMMVAGVAPYIEEVWRCWNAQNGHPHSKAHLP